MINVITHRKHFSPQFTGLTLSDVPSWHKGGGKKVSKHHIWNIRVFVVLYSMYIKVQALIENKSTCSSFLYRGLWAWWIRNSINEHQRNQIKLFHQTVCCDNDTIWPRQISSVNPVLLLDQIRAHNGWLQPEGLDPPTQNTAPRQKRDRWTNRQIDIQTDILSRTTNRYNN